jgi:hypothetical protein
MAGERLEILVIEEKLADFAKVLTRDIPESISNT